MSESPDEAIDSLESTDDADGTQYIGKALPLWVTNIDQLAPQFVNLLSINNDRDVFQLVFSQFLRPLVSSGHDAKRLHDQGYVAAAAVARLILTRQMMGQVIDVLQSEMRRYDEEQSAEEGLDG